MNKLSTEQLLTVYENAIKFRISKEFIILLSEELLKRNIIVSIK
ncbi:sporulation histidine kinase inhibitor Sda [Neobacillus sp. 179-J 1A1 HS]